MSLENPTSHNNFNANVRLTRSQSGNLHGDISNSIDEQIKLPHQKLKGPGCKKFAPTAFSTKIPNRKALRDFFYNHCKKYCPSYRDLTAGFAKEVLAGRKFLLNLEQVRFVDEIPQFKELSTKNI